MRLNESKRASCLTPHWPLPHIGTLKKVRKSLVRMEKVKVLKKVLNKLVLKLEILNTATLSYTSLQKAQCV